MFEIMSLDIRIDKQIFDGIATNVVDDESHSTGTNYSWTSKEATLSNSGLTMYKITVTDDDNSDSIDIVAEKSQNDMVFKPFELRNFNSSFYKATTFTNINLNAVFLRILYECALKAKGDFGYINDNQDRRLVSQGKSIHVKSLAIVDDKNKVYTLKSQDLSTDDDDEDCDSMGFVPKYVLNEWLEENPMFNAKLQTVPKDKQFELMGQFAIYQKKNNMLSANKFRDIIIQIGTFADLVGGFKDENLNNLYHFFV